MNNDPSLTIPQGLIDALRSARSVAVLTGAGISAESGLATFRDAQTGLWANFRPEDLATAEAFERDPRMVWEWYAWRRALIEQAQPNASHHALVTIEERVPIFTLVTQNIDSLHQRAGSHNVIELHGNISRVKCFTENIGVEEWQAGDEVPPRCPRCGGLLRPDVVWFGELLPEQAFERAVEATTHCDVFFSIGTSGVVEPAASLVRVAQRYHAVTAIINLDVTPRASQHSYQINGPAGVVLPRLVQMAWP
jgi:NAD-dependent deacetylase